MQNILQIKFSMVELTKRRVRMVYRYDYDVKNNLIDLLEAKQDFSGVLEMPYYLEQYHQETSTARQNLQRFLIYKLSSYLSDTDLKQFDCDVCEEMTTSYLKAYHWLDGYWSEQQPSTAVKYEVTNGDITYRGDTMTSAGIPIKNYIQLKMSGQSKIQGNMWELYFLRNMEKIKLSPEAGRFLQLTHSIGNFIPVPSGFNTGRSGEYAKWDSWDLTLTQIFQWYTDNSNMTDICNHGALERLFTYAKNPKVGPIAGWPPHKDIESSKYVIDNIFTGAECYAICEKENNVAIGAVELKLNGHTDMTDRDDECELGYWLGEPFWGRGYMPEAAYALMKRGFETLEMTTIWCGYYDGNKKSKRVQEKLGFIYHHTCDEVPVPLLNEVRVGHTNVITKEQWKSHTQPDGKIHVANIEEV